MPVPISFPLNGAITLEIDTEEVTKIIITEYSYIETTDNYIGKYEGELISFEHNQVQWYTPTYATNSPPKSLIGTNNI